LAPCCTPRMVMDWRKSSSLYNGHILHRRYVIYNWWELV